MRISPNIILFSVLITHFLLFFPMNLYCVCLSNSNVIWQSQKFRISICQPRIHNDTLIHLTGHFTIGNATLGRLLHYTYNLNCAPDAGRRQFFFCGFLTIKLLHSYNYFRISFRCFTWKNWCFC